MAMGDNLARDRRPQSSILTGISKARQPEPPAAEIAGAEAEPGERLIALPEPGSAYVAFARPNNKPLTTLRFVMGETVRGFPYASLDSIDLMPADKPGGGPVIVMVFDGIVPRKAVLSGRHLLLLYDQLSDHRIAWVRVLPEGRDFKEKSDSTTVITGIAIERVKDAKDLPS